jgi:multidrug efflux system outer membrane protein
MTKTMRTLVRAVSPLAVAALLSACATMAPDYERPAAPVVTALPFSEPGIAQEVELVDWRAVVGDATLSNLIETALASNRDLRVAILNVERARALYRVRRADSLPAISADAGYSRQRIGENASAGSISAPTSGLTESLIIEQFSVDAGVSAYELDLFGRVRSLNRQALETYFATGEARRSAEISLVAEVVNAYFQLVADRERLSIARGTVESQQDSLVLTRTLVENGLGNDLDVQRVETSVQRARADAAALEAQIGRDENALRLLVGTPALPDLRAASLGEIDIPTVAPAAVSSAVLLERPDVLAAERRLRAANANIGAARAAFFPRVLLTASAGTASADLSDLFSPGTGVWSFAPAISVPIFTGGRNRAQLASAKIDRDIALSEYENAIQSAFRDVADALATRSTINTRLDATAKLAAAAAKTYELADARFRNGVDDYLAVLDAQRADYSARQELVLVQLEEATNAINLYRAFGGIPRISGPQGD